MRIKGGLSKYNITLVAIYALVFLFFSNTPIYASTNSLSISCPTEFKPSQTTICEISLDTNIKIDKVSGNFSTENLDISNIDSESTWVAEESTNSFIAKSSSEILGESKVAKIELKANKPNSTGTLLIENLVFELEDKYAFSVASPLIEIKILSAPETPNCADDEEIIDGVCQKKVPDCNDDEEIIDGKCKKKQPTCAEDEELIGGTCQKIAPICSSDEILKDNQCIKKEEEFDYSLLGVIVGSIVFITIVIFLIVALNKKKSTTTKPKSSTYLNLSSSPKITVGGNSYAKTTKSSSNVQKYNNGNYMSRSGSVTKTTTTPKANDDPRLQMHIQNPTDSTAPQEKISSVIGEQGSPNISTDPNDPRLQIQFNNKQQEMQLKQTTSENPMMSTYDIANQAAPSQNSSSENVAQNDSPVNLPTNQNNNQNNSRANTLIQTTQSTTPVQLSKPTTPDVFES